MKSENVESVMCDGRWLMRDRTILTIQESEVLTEAQARASEIADRIRS